ncbi:Hypothetical_protein [Hexamita inflata]|uniref:Hypothetical_protein n=1 Tax=Hexamita inflata TaxID=28002 RepID=A0AA86UUE4_9EUKA|nr:Hypothetical protein HINF_LOCUS42649 [Hexamita inflata]CAI9965247.1 Hypothetical protein HINF_LOCUS52892 [Hexamita inflata]
MLSLILSFQLDLTTPCGWMLKSRIWRPYTPCTLNETHNLKDWEQYSGRDASILDFSTVNVFNLSRRAEGIYSVIDIGSSGVLQNAFLFVNSTLDLSAQRSDTLLVSVFDSVFGQLKNVSVTGFINITLNQAVITNVLLSKFIGSELGSVLTNCSSSLRFFVNGVETTSVSSFYTSVSVGAGQVLSSLVSSNKLFVKVFEIKYPTILSTNVYTSFDTTLYYNPFWDYYEGAYGQFAEYAQETMNMTVKYFKNNAELVLQKGDYDQVVYTGYTRSIAFFLNQYPVICNSNNYYDVVLKACVTASACTTASRFLLMDLCVSACPTGQFAVTITNAMCFYQCPMNKKYYKSGPTACTACSKNAYDTGCEASTTCTNSRLQFQSGCYKYCGVRANFDFNKCLCNNCA